MIDIGNIRSVTLDIAESDNDAEAQERTADVIWILLERKYQVHIVSSNPNRNWEGETFSHPGFTIPPVKPPFDQHSLSGHPQLTDASNLWVTDDSATLNWLRKCGLPHATRWESPEVAEPAGLRIGSVLDLTGILNPGEPVYQGVVDAVVQAKEESKGGAIVVGIGGPPSSGFEEFAVELKNRIESEGHSLTELLDVSPFTAKNSANESRLDWESEEAVQWLIQDVLSPVKRGKEVYLESVPENAPDSFAVQMPLFYSKESVIVALGERIFARPLIDEIDVRVLFQVSPREAARRNYDIGEENFDPKFIEQFEQNDGQAYYSYLKRNEVEKNVNFRINADNPNYLVWHK